MSRLLLLKQQNPETTASPELEYLLSLCRLQAARVWDRVDLVETSGEGPIPGPVEGADVLVMSQEPILVAERSLAAMRRRIGEGASVVLPVALTEAEIAAADEIYTLRDFEEVERRFLDRSHRPEAPPRDLDPVALVSDRAFAADREIGSTNRRSLRHLESRFEGDLVVEREGLYHRFIDYYGEIRTDVISYLPEEVDDLLEVGCGRGATGAMLQDRLGCRVTGVELNPVVAEEARRRLHAVVAGDVAEVDLEGRFDAILALELFEHLPRPEPVLSRLGSLLRPGGRLVLSVPNVGHHSVVTDLLAGRWDYLPIGLLCYTHYRFFTRRTLEDWIRRAGFDRFVLVPQKTPVPDEVAELEISGIDRESLATKGFWALIEG